VVLWPCGNTCAKCRSKNGSISGKKRASQAHSASHIGTQGRRHAKLLMIYSPMYSYLAEDALSLGRLRTSSYEIIRESPCRVICV
jgi:hypothetical protein